MALNKSGSKYSNFILVIASEEPAYDIGTRLMMYGTSVGMSITGDEGQAAEGETATTDSYPYFEAAAADADQLTYRDCISITLIKSRYK